MIEKLYSLYKSGSDKDIMPWSVFGHGFGLRCFPTKETAVKEATDCFGQACFTIRIWPDRTQMHVVAAPECDPRRVLDQAIKALEEERADLDNCPVHQRRNDK